MSASKDGNMKIRILEILVSKQRWKYEYKHIENTCQQASQQASQTLSPCQHRVQAPVGGKLKKLPMLISKTKMLKVHSKTFVLLINMNKILGLVVTLSLSMIVFSLWAIVSTVQSANSFLWITIRSAERSG